MSPSTAVWRSPFIFTGQVRKRRDTRKLCDQFSRRIERREGTYANFRALLERLRKGLDEAGDSLAALQRAHRGVLLKLSTLRTGA